MRLLAFGQWPIGRGGGCSSPRHYFFKKFVQIKIQTPYLIHADSPQWCLVDFSAQWLVPWLSWKLMRLEHGAGCWSRLIILTYPPPSTDGWTPHPTPTHYPTSQIALQIHCIGLFYSFRYSWTKWFSLFKRTNNRKYNIHNTSSKI